jgi:hypothetical protein
MLDQVLDRSWMVEPDEQAKAVEAAGVPDKAAGDAQKQKQQASNARQRTRRALPAPAAADAAAAGAGSSAGTGGVCRVGFLTRLRAWGTRLCRRWKIAVC